MNDDGREPGPPQPRLPKPWLKPPPGDRLTGTVLAECACNGQVLQVRGAAATTAGWGAVDAGRRVTVVADACAAVSDSSQEQTPALPELLSPMVTVVTSRELMAVPA